MYVTLLLLFLLLISVGRSVFRELISSLFTAVLLVAKVG